MLKDLDHPRKLLINVYNIKDNECFKWCLVRYLNLEDGNPVIITKTDKDFTKKLDLKNIKIPVRVSTQNLKKSSSVLVLLVMKIR